MSLGPKMPYFGTFRQEFGNTFVIFEIRSFKFVDMQSSMLKEKK